MLLGIILALALAISGGTPAGAAEQPVSATIKKIFSTPTPAPRPPNKKGTAIKKRVSPSPTSKRRPSPTPMENAPTIPTPTATPPPTPAIEASAAAAPAPSPSLPPEQQRPANATLTPDQIKDFDQYPENVQKLLASALELTTRSLDYKYGSDDPANGGMDCSGFVYFVLRQNGIDQVPRDSSQQYVWLRRLQRFEPVVSHNDDSFELERLKPGDLLFWAGTYSIERDPPITHTMIYLGRERKSGKRVMVGASDGRIYQGQPRYGVSVFDFKLHNAAKPEQSKRPVFVGYGHVPGVGDKQD
jgi:cell wall-associated NlpC family hydrolase